MKISTVKYRKAAYNAATIRFAMDLQYLVYLLFLDKEKKRKPRNKLFRHRAEEGAFNILVSRHLMDDDTKFKEYFRASPLLFSEILNGIKDDLETIPTTSVQRPISAHFKLCVTLRYLATGESLRSLAIQFGAHVSTISRIVDKCLASIIRNFLEKALPQPTSKLFGRIIHNYFVKWNFPNCCGAIDGKHIRIKSPPRAGSAYNNCKDFNSVVLLTIVDANYKFIAVDVGSYGREGDAGIFSNSCMGRLINEGNFNVPPPSALPSTEVVLPNMFIGNQAFSLTYEVLTPYPRQSSSCDQAKAIFNYRLCRARRTTENAFRIMSSYFRIFFAPINAEIEKIENIVLAASILHNLMRQQKIPCPSEVTFNDMTNISSSSGTFIEMSSYIGRPSSDGAAIRDKFKEFFNGVGAVDWQENSIS